MQNYTLNEQALIITDIEADYTKIKKAFHCLEYQAYMELNCFRCKTYSECQGSNIEDCMIRDKG